MAAIEISLRVDASVWEELKELADESHQSVSGLVTQAIREYLQRRRVRPVVMRHLEDSILENHRLGRVLAR